MNTQKVVSALVYRASIICLNLYSGQGAFHRGWKEEGGIFFFPIMHQQQDPNWHRGLGSFSRDKHPVSCLTPSKGNLPGASIHHSTHARCLLKHNQKTRETDTLVPAQLTCHHGQRPHLFCFPCSFRFPWLPSLTCQCLFGTAETTVAALRKGYENSCWQMKNSCSVTIYLSIPASSFPPLSHALSFSLSG